MIWDYIRSGLELAMTWQSILMITLGLLSGIVIGAIPGMTADIGIILCMPLTYAMDPIPAMMLLLGIYCGGTYGGSITAILINTPGTPANAATTLDGYPMTRQGKSLKALQMALYASFFGGIVRANRNARDFMVCFIFFMVYAPFLIYLHCSVAVAYVFIFKIKKSSIT